MSGLHSDTSPGTYPNSLSVLAGVISESVIFVMVVRVLTLSPCQASTDSRAAIQISSRKTSSRKTSKPYFCNHQFRSEADRCEVLASFVLSSHGGSLRCSFNNRRLVQLGLSFRTRVARVGERFMLLRRVRSDFRRCRESSSRSNPSIICSPAQP